MKIIGSSTRRTLVKYALALKNHRRKHHSSKKFKMKTQVSDKLLQLIQKNIRRRIRVVVVANVRFTELKMTRQHE